MIFALFPALLSNCKENILHDFKTLGLVLFGLFCVRVIRDHLNNAGFSLSLSSHSSPMVGGGAFLDLQCLIHDVYMPTRETLCVQRKEKEFYTMLIVYYHQDTTTDMWGLRGCSRSCLQTSDSRGFSSQETFSQQENTVWGHQFPSQSSNTLRSAHQQTG